MSHFEFIVPIQRDDLLEAQQGGQYFVRNLSEACEVKSSIHELTVAFSSDRGEFILDKFDLLFSGLKHFSALKSADREQIWELVNKGFTYLTGDITNVLEQDDVDSELRLKYLNLLKMSTYILCQMAELFENTVRPSTVFISDKGRERAKSSASTEMDWDSQRLRVLSSLYAMLQLQLRRLWDPPIPDEEFVNLIGNVCYRFLENSSVSQVKSKTLRDSIFQVLGTLVRSYSHSHCCSLKMILMLQQYEHAAGVLSQGVLAMATQYGGVGLMNDMIRELAGMDAEELTREGAATRHYAEFLSLVAARAPELVLNNICLLVGHLDGESYTMRNAVLSMIGDMVSLVLTGEQLDDKQKHLRDQFLDNLEDHMHDVNAFVRTKVLQIWRKLCTDGAVPLSRQRVVLGRAVGRLHDKSSNVRKAALQLITAFLQVNPFAAKLPVAELEAQYKCERDKLSALGAAVDDPDEAADGDSDAESDEEDAAEDDGGDPSLALQRAKTFLVTSLQAALGNSSFQPSLAEDRMSLLKLLVEGNQETDAMEQMIAKPHLIPGYSKRQASDTDGSTSDSPSACAEDGVQEAGPLTLDQLVAVLNAMDTETAAVDLAKQAEIDKQKMIVLYFRDSVEFARLMDASIPSVCGFLRSSQTTDILEAISFFVTAFEFGLLKAMVGIRSMLSLIWSREANIKDSVVTAYRRLYMPASENAKTRAAGLVDNLSTLCADASVGELAALEELVAHLVRSGDLSDVCVQLLWQRFTRAQPGDVTSQQARAALILIGMAAGSEPSIVSSNLDVLIQFGLQPPVSGQPLDLRVVQHACTALLKIAPKKPKPDAKHPPQRMENSHQLFSLLSDILVESIGRDDDVYYSPMALNAVDVFYLLADRPDPLMAAVVRRLSQLVADGDSSLQLARFVCVCGHAALSQMNFLDVHVFCELKRRNRVREEAKEQGDGRAAQRQPARAGTGTGTPGSASETPRNRRLSQDADGDDDGLTGAVADDVEAEHINDICENHIVTSDGLLAAYLPLLVEINSNPDRYQDQRLRAAAALALSKYMTVSSVVCEQHLQLLFTILERSEDDVIRSNIIIALGDLSFRFPNLIEPWTPRIYARLQDTSVSVRRTTLTVLTHLILNDMVKVKGQISDMAVRIVDPVDGIAGKARSFFAELANKGNALYNVMADIISRLSDTDVGVPESDFQIILRFILGLIQKDRQLESLVEKLCLRFRGAALPRHWRDLAFCMSLLNFSDRCVRKLTDNFSCFSDKLHDKDVHDCFIKIISNSKKLSKSSEVRSQIEELEARLTEARKKAVEDDNATCSAARAAGRPTPDGAATPAQPLPDTPLQEEDTAPPERRSVCKAVPTPRRSAFSAQRLRRTRDSTAPAAGDQIDDGAEEPFRAPAPPPPVQSKSRRATRTSSRRH